MSTAIIEERGIEEIILSLSEPLPESVVKQRIGWTDRSGEQHWVDYIDWHTAANVLDRECPDWSHEVRNVTTIGDLVAVTVAITIKGVTRCGVGVGSALDEKGIKGAETDALKRAAVKFGLARTLYKRDKDRRRKESVSGAAAGPTGDESPVTEKQLSAIYAIARAKSLDAHLESMALFGREPERLNRSAASELIEHLRNVRISA